MAEQEAGVLVNGENLLRATKDPESSRYIDEGEAEDLSRSFKITYRIDATSNCSTSLG